MRPFLGDGGGNLGALGLPADPLALTSLLVACFLLLRAPRNRLLSLSARTFLWLVAVASFLGSFAYVHVYLHGGPRIIDATTYYLQGAALSHGELTWQVPAHAPPESFRGRFLLAPTETSLTGIFPVGYPLLLAAAFVFHVPMLLGPLLGALLTVATYRLTRILAQEQPEETRETAARISALLCVGSGALRYHTADTMSHGLSMLLATVALTEIARLHAGLGNETRSLTLASFCTTYLGITRFASAIPLVVLLLALVMRRKGLRRWRTLSLAGLFPVLGLLFQLQVQHAQTGSYFTPAQSLYYRLSDGPEGCFRYGFGRDIGCLNEHGAFVRSQLPNGYGLFEALKTTGRRLLAHGGDAANASLFLPLVFFGLRIAKNVRGVLAAYLVLHVCAYAPFYFDGNYPGGGARLFSELLPLELSLIAVGVFSLRALTETPGRGLLVAAAAFFAFAIHASFAHISLRDRDGGTALYRPEVFRAAGVTDGIVFLDTDHGFNLAYADSLHEKVVVARYRGDAFDRLLYDRLGAPKSYRYVRDGNEHRVEAFVPEPLGQNAVFQAESFWPPRELTGGYAFPAWAPYAGPTRQVYVFRGGAPIVRVPEGGSRVRYRNCSLAAACNAGPWLPVPTDRRLSLAPQIAANPPQPHELAESCDSIEVFFPVAGSP